MSNTWKIYLYCEKLFSSTKIFEKQKKEIVCSSHLIACKLRNDGNWRALSFPFLPSLQRKLVLLKLVAPGTSQLIDCTYFFPAVCSINGTRFWWRFKVSLWQALIFSTYCHFSPVTVNLLVVGSLVWSRTPGKWKYEQTMKSGGNWKILSKLNEDQPVRINSNVEAADKLPVVQAVVSATVRLGNTEN